MDKIQLKTKSAKGLSRHWRRIKNNYTSPLFLCHPETLRTIRKFHDRRHIYFWDVTFGAGTSSHETLFKVPLKRTAEEGIGLYVVEDKMKAMKVCIHEQEFARFCRTAEPHIFEIDGVPEDAQLLSVNYDVDYRCFVCVFRHDSFEDLPAGKKLPEKIIEYKRSALPEGPPQ